jgi:hypothetical protein
MSDVIWFVVESISRDRRLRLLTGLTISGLAVWIVSFSLVYGTSIDQIIERYTPVILGFLFSIAGLSLAFSTQKITGGRRKKSDDRKDIDDKDLIKSKSTELADMFHAFRIRMMYDSDRLRQTVSKIWQ